MDRKQQVLLKLKPKVKAFGFNKKELMSVAAKIADNLNSEEDAYLEGCIANAHLYISKLLCNKAFRAKSNSTHIKVYVFDMHLFGTSLLPETKRQ